MSSITAAASLDFLDWSGSAIVRYIVVFFVLRAAVNLCPGTGTELKNSINTGSLSLAFFELAAPAVIIEL